MQITLTVTHTLAREQKSQVTKAFGREQIPTINLQHRNCGWAVTSLSMHEVALHKREDASKLRNAQGEQGLGFSLPQDQMSSPPLICLIPSKCFYLSRGRNCKSFVSRHCGTGQAAVIPQGAEAQRHQTRGLSGSGRRQWVGSDQDPRILYVEGPLQKALSTDKGIRDSHVNLSPIKLSAEGQVAAMA